MAGVDGRPEPLRREPLPHDRTLVVRPMTPHDVSDLVDLYEELSIDDLHRRFFSAFHPSAQFLDRWARLGERGGVGLVAVVQEPDGSEHVVADAGYELLPNGNGELAITVSRAWRGWLGPYLLDVLVDEAAARGVPNLEAEVLSENRPMLSLVRGRGYAMVDHPDWTVVRVTVGTSGRTPTWPQRPARPRLLVEVGGGRWSAEQEAHKAGFEVIACPGPQGRPHGRCPLLEGGRCPLADGADVIVVDLRPDDPATQALIDRHAAGGAALVVEAADGANLAVPEGVERVTACSPATALVQAVERALVEHPHPRR